MKNDEMVNEILFKKYKILSCLSSGNFGKVYIGENINTNVKVAIKLEPTNTKKEKHLEREAMTLNKLKGKGIPELIIYGRAKENNVIIEQLLAKNMMEIFKENDNKLSLKDICLLGIQIIERLEYIHSQNIIHRDIKPENLLLGYPDFDTIYLIDYGLSKVYINNSEHIKYNNIHYVIGTPRYASINSIKGYELSRRDDLESLFYTLYFLYKGYLPWQFINQNNIEDALLKLYEMKKNYNSYCKNLPNEFIYFIKYVRQLRFDEKPDYEFLKNLFKDVISKNSFGQNFDFNTKLNNCKKILVKNAENKKVELQLSNEVKNKNKLKIKKINSELENKIRNTTIYKNRTIIFQNKTLSNTIGNNTENNIIYYSGSKNIESKNNKLNKRTLKFNEEIKTHNHEVINSSSNCASRRMKGFMANEIFKKKSLCKTLFENNIFYNSTSKNSYFFNSCRPNEFKTTSTLLKNITPEKDKINRDNGSIYESFCNKKNSTIEYYK